MVNPFAPKPPKRSAGLSATYIWRVAGLLSLLFIALAISMYFGTTAGSGAFDFVDIKIKTESISAGAGNFIGHYIVDLHGFNSVTVTGAVRAKSDVTGPVWLGVYAILGKYDGVDKCGRLKYTGTTVQWPGPKRAYAILKLTGMKAGDTKSFSYTIKKSTLLDAVRYKSSVSENKTAGSWTGSVYVVVFVPKEKGWTVGYQPRYMEVESEIAKKKALTWKFNTVTSSWVHSVVPEEIVTGGCDLCDPEIPLSHSIMTHGTEMSLKISNSGAVLLAAVIIGSMLMSALGLSGSKRGRKGSMGRLLLIFAVVSVAIAAIVIGILVFAGVFP